MCIVIYRLQQRIEINKYAFKEGIGKEESVKDNVLFLTLIAQLNGKTSNEIIVWFIEKNQFGSSELFSLADFKTAKVRNKSAFDKNYIQGKYGAIPYFEIDDKPSSLLYGEE